MANIAGGGWTETSRKLLQALGLKGVPIVKAVIEIDMKDVVRLYLKTHATVEQIKGLTAAIEGMEIIPVEEVAVTDDGTVAYTSKQG